MHDFLLDWLSQLVDHGDLSTIATPFMAVPGIPLVRERSGINACYTGQ
jgi:hypothetical protein